MRNAVFFVAGVTATHWNHRVTKQVLDGEVFFAIREVYYENDEPTSWTVNPVAAVGDSLDEVETDLRRMLAACQQPVLDLDAIEAARETGSGSRETQGPPDMSGA